MPVSLKNVWVIEDEEGARYVYENVFANQYALKLFSSVDELRSALSTSKPDLMLCDLGLPGESFLSFLESPASRLIDGVPFIVVSSLDDTEALRKCFAKGALDYITKPFGKGELLVKTECILARPSQSAAGPYATGAAQGLRIDPSTMRVHHGESTSSLLTAKEFQILSLLQQAPQHTVSRNEIVQKVWGNVKVGSKTLDVHIFNLRRKLNPIQVEISFGPPNQYRLSYH
jgi:DNA-binding response OmpR family regulator